jgi:copper chaperone CopZ
MSVKSLLISAVLTVGFGGPAFAVPTLKATVGHLCCGGCEGAVKANTGKVAWVAETQTNRGDNSVTVTAKDGMEVDAFALIHSLQRAGFPPTALLLSGAQTITMDVGHLCCGGCVNPLKSALTNVPWIQNADVKANAPVVLTIKGDSSPNLTELLDVMGKAGYSANKLTITN